MTTVLAPELPQLFGCLFEPSRGGARYRVFYGGRGSAKSWSIARALLIHGCQAPLRILCTREYQSSIADSVHKLLEDQISAIGLEGFYEVKQNSILGQNGTEFLFKGLRRNIREIKSTEGIDLCWVEEAEAVSQESWQILSPTIRKEHSEIWVSFNPALEGDPTYQKFIVKPPENAIVTKAGYTDNPWCPQVLIDEAEELKRRDPEAYEHIWGGLPWTRSDAQVLGGRYIVDEFAPKDSWNGPYFGADWGFAQDPTVLVKLWVADSRLYLEYETAGKQWGFDHTAKQFKAIPGAASHVIRADAARPETINDMRQRSLNCVAAPKWAGSVEDGVEHLRSYETIVIHPRCKLAQEQARLWSYKTDPRTGDVLPKLKDGNDDVWDATRYALAPLIQKGRGVKIGHLGT